MSLFLQQHVLVDISPTESGMLACWHALTRRHTPLNLFFTALRARKNEVKERRSALLVGLISCLHAFIRSYHSLRRLDSRVSHFASCPFRRNHVDAATHATN